MIKNHIIGVVGLARGNVAFYDPITKIHLTLAQPQACVWNYMNTIGLKKAVRGKAIVIVSGYLYENHIIPNVTHDTTPIKNPKDSEKDSGAFDSTATPVSDEQYTSIDISDNVVMPEEVQETVQEPLEETAVEAENAVEEENVTEEKVDDQSEAQPEEEEKKPARKSRKKKSTEE